MIYDMEKVAQVFAIEPFEMFLLGGSACILGGYTERATRDFDFVDINYPARYGRAFSLLRDFDMLEYSSTILSPKYKERARKLKEFTYLNIFILSVEDIIVSKIIRLEDKDIEDINILIDMADKKLINQIIQEVLGRKDLYESKKEGFLNKLPRFRGLYDV